MATLFYGTISTVNYERGTANITLPDRENQIITDVPFLSSEYIMPGSGDMVAVIFEEIDGQIGKGVILGKMYLAGNVPKVSGRGVYHKDLPGGAAVDYKQASGEMEISAKKVIVDELVYRTLTQG